MAVDKTSASAPSYVSTFNSTGNWTAPTNTNKVYVALKGTSGGASPGGTPGGNAVMGGAYVTVAGGVTYPVIIGAAGNNGVYGGNCSAYGSVPTRYSYTIGCIAYNVTTNGNNGGTSSWDSNAIVVYGGLGSSDGSQGSSGSVSFDTTLPALYPTGANARVTSTSTTNANAGAGQAFVFTV